MDAQQQLVWDADVSVAVLGRAGEFVLISTDRDASDEELISEARAREFYFCGVLGVMKDGRAHVACEPGLDAAQTMLQASLGFAHRVADRLRAGDSVTWLEKLFAIEDPRGN